jgi:hypothetical protein
VSGGWRRGRNFFQSLDFLTPEIHVSMKRKIISKTVEKIEESKSDDSPMQQALEPWW